MFRNELPRVYELIDHIEDPNAPTAFFQAFNNSICDDPSGGSKLLTWRRREEEFQGLDSKSWESLKNEARPYLTTGNPNGRGWEQLIAILNQARAFNFLSNAGCTDIQFIPRTEGKKTPDLKGKLHCNLVLCEVKTLFQSDDEVRRRGEGRSGETRNSLDPRFFNKLEGVINTAKDQMEAFENGKKARRIVYVIPNFDDRFGEYKVNYYEEIDQYLGNHPVSGVEIVFHNEQTCFPAQIPMTNATVVNESE
ncbi:MAG: hypothetical protein ACE5E9_13330 [Nitrospinaceae bacterium]